MLAILYVGTARFLARSYFLRAERAEDSRKRVAIYGAGSAGTQLAYALRAGREYLPVVFFDDDPGSQRTEVAGLRVHDPDDLATVLAAKEIEEVLLAIPSASRGQAPSGHRPPRELALQGQAGTRDVRHRWGGLGGGRHPRRRDRGSARA
jgi:FlaA1/EpsC-like NDP-sugar epimerase